MATERTCLLTLPPELRLRIFSFALSSIDIHAVLGPPMTSPKRIPGLRDEYNLHPVEDNEWENMDPPTPFYRLDVSIPLLLVSKQVRNEVFGLSWESHVRFVFPSTVSMIDTLIEWPRNRVERIRKLKLLGTPLPLYPIDNDTCYHTHGADSGLALFKGLQLDLLEYEDAYLPSDDGWGRGTVPHEMTYLMESLGWKQLHFLAKQPYLREDEVKLLVNMANSIRQDRKEPGYDFDLPTTPVERDERGRMKQLNIDEDPKWETRYDDKESVDGDSDDEDRDDEIPDDVDPGDENPDEEDQDDEDLDDRGSKLERKQGFQPELIMTVTRAKGANYVQHDYGTAVTDILKALLERMTWRQLRESGDYLVDEGTQSPCNHL